MDKPCLEKPNEADHGVSRQTKLSLSQLEQWLRRRKGGCRPLPSQASEDNVFS